MNRATLIGHLGADPDIGTTQSGQKWASFRIATTEKWKDKTSGDVKSQTEWHTIKVWSEPLVKVTEQYLKKGQQVLVEGKIVTRKWQDKESGADRYSTEIVLQGYDHRIQMLGGKPEGGNNRPPSAPNDEPPPGRTDTRPARDGFEDEIPF